ncbi:signal peptidase II [Maricaulaceae bacterium EIL42A08]|nr:signal peptidase II [Maricaulaceae bacterium EIL42A08]
MRPMFGRPRRSPFAVLGYLVAVVFLIADQISKHVILRIVDLDVVGQIEVLDPWFNFTMVWNRGVSFGLFQAGSWWQIGILIAVSVGVSLMLAVWMMQAERRLQAISFGMIIGGAIGNVIDRFAYGAVADFLDFSGLYFPYVFNVADAAISVGVALLVLDLFISKDEPRRF